MSDTWLPPGYRLVDAILEAERKFWSRIEMPYIF